MMISAAAGRRASGGGTPLANRALKMAHEHLSNLLLLLGIDEPEVLDACVSAFQSPSSDIFSVPTSALTRYLKQLKATCPPESKAKIEGAFMDFVTKVRGPRAVCRGPPRLRVYAALPFA